MNKIFRMFNGATLIAFHGLCIWFFITTEVGWPALIPPFLFAFLVTAIILELVSGTVVDENYQSWVILKPHRKNETVHRTEIGSAPQDLGENLNHYVKVLNWDLGDLVICVPSTANYWELAVKIQNKEASRAEIVRAFAQAHVFVKRADKYVAVPNFWEQYNLCELFGVKEEQ